MPFAGEIYEKSARIGFWNMTESEASLRAGITLSPTSMSLVNRSGSAKRRIELLAVRSLMHRMGISDNDLYYDENEKPLLHSGRHISISHSGTMACVALSGEPVGVDIQEIKPRLSTVMKWLLKGKKSAVTDESLVSCGRPGRRCSNWPGGRAFRSGISTWNSPPGTPRNRETAPGIYPKGTFPQSSISLTELWTDTCFRQHFTGNK